MLLTRGENIKATDLKIDLGYSEDEEDEAEDSEEAPDMMPALSLTKAKSSYPNMGKLRRATGTKPIGLLEHRASEPVQSLAALVKEVSKEMPLVKIVWKKADHVTAVSVDQYTTLSDVFRQVANAKSTKRFPSPRTVSNSAAPMSLLATNEPMEALVYPPEVRDYAYYYQVFRGATKCYVAPDKKQTQQQQELFDYIYKLKTSQFQSADDYSRKKHELLAKLKSNIETGHGAKSAVLKSTALAFASLLEAKKQKMSSSLVVNKDGDQDNLAGRSSTVVTDEGPQFKDYIPVIDNLANTGCSNLVNVMDKSSALSKDSLGASVVRIGTVELPGLLPLLNSFTKNPLRFASKHPGELVIKPSNLQQNENIMKLLAEEIGKCFGSSIPVLRTSASLELIRIKRETSRDQMSNFSILGK